MPVQNEQSFNHDPHRAARGERPSRGHRPSGRGRRASSATFGSRTDVGCVRDHNEDSLVVAPPLFVVADGMGGHAAGEVASEIAVNVIAERAPEHPDANELGRAIQAANHAILKAAHEGRGREGMGTTCTAAMLEGERLVIAQVGDSRAYLLHKGKIQQLTRDHSLMADLIEAGQLTPEEARVHPQRSVITRALGSDPRTVADLYEINVDAGDRLLLCSDGLSGMVLDQDIEAILNRVSDPQRCASQLVNEAIAAGGHDNVTVIVVDVKGFAEKRRRKVARKTKITIAFVLVLLAAIVGGAAYGLNYWVSTAAYLGVDQGKVAIYRGVPGEFAGMSFSTLEKTTDIDVDDLQPGLANRLAENSITCDNVEAAESLVAEYEQEVLNKKQTEDERDRTRDEAQSDDSKSSGQSASATASTASSEKTQNDDTSPSTSGSGDAA